jgi:tetratricopeptide (TPR) repeat protein
MAPRTLNHLIEEASILFFKQSLPKMWVCREKGRDYGVDCEVEIFDDNGNSTGLVFWVQLKGTNEKKDKKIKNKSFKNEKLLQFKSYDIAVMIVRYSSIKQTQYFKWARNVAINSDNKNTNVQFFESEIWKEGVSKEIIAYLHHQNIVKRGSFYLPIRTFVGRIENDNEIEIPYSNIVTIKQCLNNKKEYFEVVNNITEATLQIKVAKTSITTSLSDCALATMGISFEGLEPQYLDILTKHILITFCQVLYDVGRNDLADKIFLDNTLFEVVKHHKEYLITLLPYLLNGNSASVFLRELNKYFSEINDDNLVAIITQVILLARRKNNNKLLLEAIEDFLLVQLQIAKDRKDSLGIATASYNLGNVYRSQSQLNESLKYYLDARKVDMTYKNQPYYYYEMAGVLFLMKKYYFSNLFYNRAIELNTDSPYAKALLGHTYIYLGNYQAAVEQIDKFLNEQNDNNTNTEEWQLWYSCLSTLLNSGYPKIQKRNKVLAEQYVIRKDFEKSIDADLLCAVAWFNRGVMEAGNKNHLEAYISFTFAGLLETNDVEAWVNATLCIFNVPISDDIKQQNNVLLNLVIKTAFYYNQYGYISKLQEILKQQSPETLDTFMEIVDKITEVSRHEDTIVRLFSEHNTYTTFKFK